MAAATEAATREVARMQVKKKEEEEEEEEETTGTQGDLLAELANEIEVLNSPYTSAQTFEELGLSQALLRGVYEKKFNRPSKIQGAALPVILGKRNLIAQAQSGTGKTAAFVLGMLSQVEPAVAVPQAVCLCPTRELARQIVGVVRDLGRHTRAQAFLCVPEAATPPRGAKLAEHVVVGTPGSVLGLFGRKSCDERAIRVLVLDEADVMLDQQGLGDQSVRLAKLLPKRCQYLLFSATFPQRVAEFARRVVPEPVSTITLKPRELVIARIRQFFIDCGSPQRRFAVLCEVYKSISIGQSIIFVQTQQTAEFVGQQLVDNGFTVSVIHGGFSPEERDTILDRFRLGRTRVLVSTNVLARGIDVLQVSLVVNYDVPLSRDGTPEPETYLHRIGRTARYGRSGIAVNLIGDSQAKEALMFIGAKIGHRIEELPAAKIETLDEMLRECRRNDEENLRRLHLEQAAAEAARLSQPSQDEAAAAAEETMLHPQHPRQQHQHHHRGKGKKEADAGEAATTTATDAEAEQQKQPAKEKPQPSPTK